MLQKEISLGAYFAIRFSGYNSQLGKIEIGREKKFFTSLLLTFEQIQEFKDNLDWLQGTILKYEKLQYEHPPGSEYRDEHGDEEC